MDSISYKQRNKHLQISGYELYKRQINNKSQKY